MFLRTLKNTVVEEPERNNISMPASCDRLDRFTPAARYRYQSIISPISSRHVSRICTTMHTYVGSIFLCCQAPQSKVATRNSKGGIPPKHRNRHQNQTINME